MVITCVNNVESFILRVLIRNMPGGDLTKSQRKSFSSHVPPLNSKRIVMAEKPVGVAQ